MELRLLVFAQRALVSDGKLSCEGIFDWLPIWLPPGLTLKDVPTGTMAPLPPFAIGVVLHGGLGDPPKVNIALRVVDGHGHVVFGEVPMFTTAFERPKDERPMSAVGAISLPNLHVPGPGEYSFEILADGHRIGGATLYVVLVATAT